MYKRQILASAYEGSPDKAAYYEAIKTALSDNDTAINLSLIHIYHSGLLDNLCPEGMFPQEHSTV